jgi:hypothetical protein
MIARRRTSSARRNLSIEALVSADSGSINQLVSGAIAGCVMTGPPLKVTELFGPDG